MRNSRYEVYITEVAEQDLNDIIDYLNGFAPEIDSCYYRLIKEKLYDLQEMPTVCSLIRNERLRELGYRWANVKNYMIFFVVDEIHNTVSVKRIQYARQDFDALL